MKDIRHISIIGSGKEALASAIIENVKNVTVLDADNKKKLEDIKLPPDRKKFEMQTLDLKPYIPEPKNFINGKKLPKKRK